MIEFIEKDHLYISNGRPVPSVTSILVRTGIINTEHFSEYCRERGSALHKALEYLDQNNLDEDTVDDQIKGYIESYKAFKEDVGPQITHIERVVHSKDFDYAGTFDRGMMINGHHCLVDIKSGQFFKYFGLQLAAYQQAAKECGISFTKRFVLELKPVDRKYRLREMADPLALLNFLRARNELKAMEVPA
jgi:hypothetical protein